MPVEGRATRIVEDSTPRAAVFSLAELMRPLSVALLCAVAVSLNSTAFGASALLEDPAAREALPEFKTIPAARPEELSPAEKIDPAPFGRWTRSQGDNGARRYSALNQITRENVQSLKMVWTYRSGDLFPRCRESLRDGVRRGKNDDRPAALPGSAVHLDLGGVSGHCTAAPAAKDFRKRTATKTVVATTH